MHGSVATRPLLWDKLYAGLIPPSPVTAVTVPGNRFTLEGHDLAIVEVSHTDSDDTSVLHVPASDWRRSPRHPSTSVSVTASQCDGNAPLSRQPGRTTTMGAMSSRELTEHDRCRPERARWPRLAAAPHPLLRPMLPRGYVGFTEATAPRHLVLPATTSVPLVVKILDSAHRPPPSS